VTVVDGVTNEVIRTITVGAAPIGFCHNAGANRMYVANFWSSSISVLRDSGVGVAEEEPTVIGRQTGAAISGVAALTQGGSALRSILVVDRRGVIRGIGAPSHEGKSAKTRWYAFLGPHQTDRRFFLHAALEDGSVCRLGTGRTAQRSKV